MSGESNEPLAGAHAEHDSPPKKEPEGAAAWILTMSGPMLAACVVGFLCWQAYQSGLSITKSRSIFGFLPAIAYASPLFIMTGAIPIMGYRLANRRRGKFVGVFTISMLIVVATPVSSIFFQATAFEKGRAACYQKYDFDRLVQAGDAIFAAVVAKRTDRRTIVIESTDPRFATFPSAVTSLNPIRLFVGEEGVAIQLSGGGPATHSGIFLPNPPFEGSQVQRNCSEGISVVNEDPRVYRFVLYSTQMLFAK